MDLSWLRRRKLAVRKTEVGIDLGKHGFEQLSRNLGKSRIVSENWVYPHYIRLCC
jgi:hypothetical protein